jgi:hypothetical protein
LLLLVVVVGPVGGGGEDGGEVVEFVTSLCLETRGLYLHG